MLLGRAGRGPGSHEAVQAVSAHGNALITIMRCDVAASEEGAAAVMHTARFLILLLRLFLLPYGIPDLPLRSIPSQQQVVQRPWTGFLHAGGVLADATVQKQTLGSIRRVFAPKVMTGHLHHNMLESSGEANGVVAGL